MVTSLPSGHFVAIVICFSVFVLPSGGATVYPHPRLLDYERQADTPLHDESGRLTLERLNDFTGGTSWEGQRRPSRSLVNSNVINSSSNSRSSSSSSSNNSNSRSREGVVMSHLSSLFPEKYMMVSPGESFVRALLRSGGPTKSQPITGQRDNDVTSFSLPDDEDQIMLNFPALGASTRESGWKPLHKLPGYMKHKRLPQHLSLQMPQQRQRYLSKDELTEPRVPAKRWWGGYHRPRGQIDRRASQSKHYDCLKSCIKEGKLHPIQCHTLC